MEIVFAEGKTFKLLEEETAALGELGFFKGVVKELASPSIEQTAWWAEKSKES